MQRNEEVNYLCFKFFLSFLSLKNRTLKPQKMSEFDDDNDYDNEEEGKRQRSYTKGSFTKTSLRLV